MTVKELKEKLAGLPDDAKVFTYSPEDECDSWTDKIYVCDKNSLDPEYSYQVTEYYCQGDSNVAFHLLDHPNDKVVVIAGSY